MFGSLRGNRRRSLSFFRRTFTTIHHILCLWYHHPPGPTLSTNHPSFIHLSPTLHAPTTTATLGSLGPTSGMPFPRLFSSCISPARKTPTYLKFRRDKFMFRRFPYGHWPLKLAIHQGMQRSPWVCRSREAWRYTMTYVSERSYVAGRKVNMPKSTNDGRLVGVMDVR